MTPNLFECVPGGLPGLSEPADKNDYPRGAILSR